MVPDNNTYPSYYKVEYAAPEKETGGCLVDGGQKLQFEGRIVRVGNHRFLDLAPIPQDVCLQCWGTYSIYLVLFEKDELSLIPIDFEWLQVGTEERRLNVPVTEGAAGFADHGPLTIMLPTPELRNFVAKFADD
jgi:hypothetical protein